MGIINCMILNVNKELIILKNNENKNEIKKEPEQAKQRLGEVLRDFYSSKPGSPEETEAMNKIYRIEQELKKRVID